MMEYLVLLVALMYLLVIIGLMFKVDRIY